LPPRKPKRTLTKDRVTFWLVVVIGYFSVTLGLFPIMGIHLSLIHVVLSGLSMLAGWSLAHWVACRFLGLRPRR
jgi:hypothetical protein